MGDVAIRVQCFGKRYRIGVRRKPYATLREDILDFGKKIARLGNRPSAFNNDNGDSQAGVLWALRDVSFEIKKGEVVGIIGRNGAGKSTLLKILSRITKPTEGRAEIDGRIGSLLEVGTGFHAELTGRENIYLNGAILGMRKAEIDRKFDEIVAFAEIERLLDTPVKHYSSGMYMRLAFAVAAHLEPEILMVDEVLAVGDDAFQRKCLGKMGDVAREGRTVLFVSHNMAAVKSFCQRAILLLNGRLLLDGTPGDVVGGYMTTYTDTTNVPSRVVRALPRVNGNGPVQITHVAILATSGELNTSFSIWEPIVVELAICSSDISKPVSLWLLVYASTGEVVVSTFQYDVMEPMRLRRLEGLVRVVIDPNGLTPGRYSISAGALGLHREFYDWVDGIAAFDIRREFASGRPFDDRLGYMTSRYCWEVVT